ncbi:MAG: ArsR/SmtB family transcription factor [Anaerolineales bacterium]|jgi:DNA-binding transcriptional ArsR family regulator
MSAQSIFKLQADLCKAMSNPVRVQLVHLLREGPKRVGDLVRISGLDQATVSRNLSVLKSSGILASHREGKDIYYHIVNPKITDVCDLMRQVLAEQAVHQIQISNAMGGAQ